LTLSEPQTKASQFIESVLALRPEIAVFDCDGTLWSGDAGRDFFYWEIERGVVGVKDLRTGDQIEVERSEVAAWLRMRKDEQPT